MHVGSLARFRKPIPHRYLGSADRQGPTGTRLDGIVGGCAGQMRANETSPLHTFSFLTSPDMDPLSRAITAARELK